MKKFKKIASLLLAAIMVIAMAVPAMAYSITIKPSGTVPLMGKTFSVYKLLDTEMVDVNDESKGVVYKVPENMVKFYTTYFEGLD